MSDLEPVAIAILDQAAMYRRKCKLPAGADLVVTMPPGDRHDTIAQLVTRSDPNITFDAAGEEHSDKVDVLIYQPGTWGR